MNDATATILTITALVGALVTWWKWLGPRYRRMRATSTAVVDVLVGREAVHDSITGQEIAPALLGVGQRMDTVERAVATLADQHVQLEDHEGRLKALEQAAVERVVTRAESAQAWSAMQAAIEAQPADPDIDI